MKLFSLDVVQKGIFVEVFVLIPQERVMQCTVNQFGDQNKQMEWRRKIRMEAKISRKERVRTLLKKKNGRQLRKKEEGKREKNSWE